MALPILTASNLFKTYIPGGKLFGKKRFLKAVHGVSLELYSGETLALIGESGCGKSTLGRLVLGLETPTSGEVLFNGQPMPRLGTQAWRRSRANVQMVFQNPLAALDRRQKVGVQVGEPFRIHRTPSPLSDDERIVELFRSVGLPYQFFDRYPHQLSGGQRQRVVLARALACRPDVLVCDEPTSALDVSIQAQILNLLQDLKQQLATATLFISHDLRVVRQISDRIAVMYLGEIVEQGPTADVLQAPYHPYTKALLSAMPNSTRNANDRVVLRGEPPNPANRPSGCPVSSRCPLADANCKRIAPVLQPIDDKGNRQVACHLAAEAQSSEAA